MWLMAITKKKKTASLNNYKSKFEKTVGDYLGQRAEYEPDRISFTQPAKQRYYLPDFKIGDATYIECKGKWTADDRAKHVWVKEQNPNVRVILLFQNSKVRLNKRSNTTYGDWATKNGLEWYCWKQGLPEELLTTIIKGANATKISDRNTGRKRTVRRRAIKRASSIST